MRILTLLAILMCAACSVQIDPSIEPVERCFLVPYKGEQVVLVTAELPGERMIITSEDDPGMWVNSAHIYPRSFCKEGE